MKSHAGRGKSWVGDVDALASVISTHLKRPGHLRYSELMMSRVMKERIIPYKAFFKALFDLQPNLSFTKESMEAAAMRAGQTLGWCRKNPNSLEDYVVRLAAKLRVMARHLQQQSEPESRSGHEASSSASASSEGSDTSSREPDAEECDEADEEPFPLTQRDETHAEDTAADLDHGHPGDLEDTAADLDECHPGDLEDTAPEAPHGHPGDLEDTAPDAQPAELTAADLIHGHPPDTAADLSHGHPPDSGHLHHDAPKASRKRMRKPAAAGSQTKKPKSKKAKLNFDEPEPEKHGDHSDDEPEKDGDHSVGEPDKQKYSDDEPEKDEDHSVDEVEKQMQKAFDQADTLPMASVLAQDAQKSCTGCTHQKRVLNVLFLLNS